jgi:antitoxin ParD1/3/4
MHIRFADTDTKFMKSAVQEGLYTSETELVRDAVRRLREQQMHISPVFQAVMKGEQAIREGRTREFTPEVMEEIFQRGIKQAKAGEPYHSQDAVPHT